MMLDTDFNEHVGSSPPDNVKNPVLDEIGQSIVFGKKPYHITDQYKKDLKARITSTLEKSGDNNSEKGAEELINKYHTRATEQERADIIDSFKNNCISCDPHELTMFKTDILESGIMECLSRIGEIYDPYFLYLGSATKIREEQQGDFKVIVGPPEIDLLQYKFLLIPQLAGEEQTTFANDPYRILMKLQYVGQDQIDTLPLNESSDTREGKRKYDISFVLLEDTNQIEGHTFVISGLHVNKKEMNQDEFMKWFSKHEKYIKIPNLLHK